MSGPIITYARTYFLYDTIYRKIGNCRALVSISSQKVLLVIGPHFPGVVVASTVILMATLFFQILVKDSSHHIPFMVSAISLAALSLFLLIVTALKDPGIVMASQIQLHECNNEDMPYCDVCNIYQDTDTAHCDMCDVCIDGLDHHCPWIGKCIGKNNKFVFNLFMIAWISYLVYFLIIASLSIT